MLSSDKTKICAYCGKGSSLTREHIIPSFLYKKHPDQKFGFNWAADKFVNSEAIIRDVCAECNNGILSELDDYGKSFYEENECQQSFNISKTLVIKYNYTLLLRWLLKISYNSLRAAGRHSNLMEKCIPFILNENDFGITHLLFLELIKDYKIKEEDRTHLPEESKSWEYIQARMFRSGWIITNSNINYLSRYVAINSFYFYFFVFSNKINRSNRRQLISTFKNKTKSAIQLSNEQNSIPIKVSNRTFVEAYEDTALILADKWRKLQS
mgnify:CR=1 FL=1